MAEVSEEAKAYHRKCMRETTAWYREHGICPRCRITMTEGRVYCPACLKKYRDEYNARYTPEQQKEYRKARCARLKEQGLCVDCGKRKARDGRTTCPTCAKKRSESKQVARIKERINKEEKRE